MPAISSRSSRAAAALGGFVAVLLAAVPASAHPGHGTEPAVTEHPALAAVGVLLVTAGSLLLTLGVQGLVSGGGTTVGQRSSTRILGGLAVAAVGAFFLL